MSAVVVGGGISGLVAACVLAERGLPVTLLEAEPQLGGLLRKLDYGAHGVFDCGMHNMYDTGIAGLDRMLFDLLRPDEWQLLEGERRDLAGVYVDGRLHANSPYIDVRGASPRRRREYLGDLLLAATAEPAAEPVSAGEFARRHFGDALAEHVIMPAMKKLFRRDADVLDPFAARLTPLGRVVLFDEAQQLDLMQSALLRSRAAFPEQRRLPLEWSAGRRSYYPRRFGIHRVIDALRARLESAGGRVICSARLHAMHRSGSRIDAIDYTVSGTQFRLESADTVMWTAALPGLATLLSIAPQGKPDRPLRTVVTNLLLDQPARMHGLYYFYCYDPGFDCFRVTDYTAYCDGAVRNGSRPLCHEMLVDETGLAAPEVLARRAVDELVRMGVVDAEARVRFARTEILASGFPMPTLNNTHILDRLRSNIAALGLTNLRLSGIMAAPGLFFQRDVLAHTYGLVAEA